MTNRCRKRLPLRPAFAFIINKATFDAEGQTLEQMGLYLPKPVFTHGQSYVALSRCGKRSNVRVMIVNDRSEDKEGVFTTNVVYKSALI